MIPLRQDPVIHAGAFVVECIADRCWLIANAGRGDERVEQTFMFAEHGGKSGAVEAAIKLADHLNDEAARAAKGLRHGS